MFLISQIDTSFIDYIYLLDPLNFATINFYIVSSIAGYNI